MLGYPLGQCGQSHERGSGSSSAQSAVRVPHPCARPCASAEACEAVANAVRRTRAGIQDDARPLGSFLFLGPTGVGKTELCKAVAEFLFDDEAALTRIDMSEYMEKHAVARLIGAPPGYIGYEEGGTLTETVRRRPYQIILFDEVEKAHAEVFNLLLQVLDDGRLTDGQGRTVDFRNTLIVLTSNLGSELFINESEEVDVDVAQTAIMDVVRATFRPEFLNRLDETILFQKLSRVDMNGVVDIQLKRLSERLESKNVHIEIDARARAWLSDMGYDPSYGARPLKRVLRRHVEDHLATMILDSSISSEDIIAISANDTGLTINKREIKAA